MLPKASQQRKIPLKPKLLRSNPLRVSKVLLLGYDPLEIEFNDDNIYIGYTRRPDDFKFIPIDYDEELSDYVKFRLWFARMKAIGAIPRREA